MYQSFQRIFILTILLFHSPIFSAPVFSEGSLSCNAALERSSWKDLSSQGIERQLRFEHDEVYGDEYLVMDSIKLVEETGEVLVSTREVPKDALTHSLDSNTFIGKIVLNSLLDYVHDSKRMTAMIFIDLNDLGLVNNFVHKQVDGDNYVRAVGRSIHKAIRENDMTFRIGGDEWVVILPDIDESELMNVAMRINHSVLEDIDANQIFQNQLNYLEKQVEVFNEDNSKPELLEEKYQQAIVELKRLKPSVSIGTTFIREGDSYDSLISRISKQSYIVKKAFKSASGRGSGKYGVDSLESEKTQGEVTPKVLPPVK